MKLFLGNGIMSSGYRAYDSKNRLVSWRQRRCEKGQRFLAKHQKKYRIECQPKANVIRNRNNYRESHPTSKHIKLSFSVG